jgi:ectoine hydroxylase-related dioxygenase (phytanoyl-CoA dioxygenase family)
VHCELPRGGAVFFHCNTLHASDTNHSPSPRWGLICCYNTKGNGKLKGSGNHPSYEMALESAQAVNEAAGVALEIWEDSELLQVGRRQWQELGGRPAL